MTGILPILLVVASAFAGGEKPPREKGKHKVVGPPLRVGGFAALRGGATPAGGVEINGQVLGGGRWGLDLGGAISSPQRVNQFQPWREFYTVSLVTDGVYALTDTVNIGPSASLSWRPYTQDWMVVGGTWIPTAGVRATTGLLTARTWQVHLTGRATVDLIQTRMVFATADVQNLNPVELQLGLRFLFARQRSPLVPEKVQ